MNLLGGHKQGKNKNLYYITIISVHVQLGTFTGGCVLTWVRRIWARLQLGASIKGRGSNWGRLQTNEPITAGKGLQLCADTTGCG
jgi:hypothetical protein